eukprot:s2809_g8.t1
MQAPNAAMMLHGHDCLIRWSHNVTRCIPEQTARSPRHRGDHLVRQVRAKAASNAQALYALVLAPGAPGWVRQRAKVSSVPGAKAAAVNMLRPLATSPLRTCAQAVFSSSAGAVNWHAAMLVCFSACDGRPTSGAEVAHSLKQCLTSDRASDPRTEEKESWHQQEELPGTSLLGLAATHACFPQSASGGGAGGQRLPNCLWLRGCMSVALERGDGSGPEQHSEQRLCSIQRQWQVQAGEEDTP